MQRSFLEYQLLRLNANVPQPKSNDKLEILLDDWMEEFEHTSEEEMIKAIKAHQRSSDFFPTIRSIREHINSLPKKQVLQLEEPELTEEQVQNNLKNLANIKKMLASKNPESNRRKFQKK
jgi:hypothetical protein